MNPAWNARRLRGAPPHPLPPSIPPCKMVNCVSCGSHDLILQESSGDTVCIRCGTVAEESNIVSAIEFQETSGGARCVG